MALVSALFGQLGPSRGRATTRGGRARQIVLRGKSGRAYAFEVYRAEQGAARGDVPAVYMYVREIPPADGAPTSPNFAIGFVGHTEAIGARVTEHERHGHFVGHGLDTLLVLWVEHAPIRIAIAEDMLAAHQPVLNDLLRGYQGAKVS
jgi:hypothetical protein